jgi:hypothetical protein
MNIIIVAVSMNHSPWLLFLWLLPFGFIIHLLYLVYLKRESAFQAFQENRWVGLMVALVFGICEVL